jgi:hypothetical protein
VERGVVTATSNYDTAEGRFDFYTATSGTSYAASDPVTVTILEIKQKNLTSGDWEYLYQNGTANNTQITKRGFTQNQVQTQWVQKVGDNYLQLGHQLNSDLTSTLMDVTPYYYTVVLSLPTEIDPRTTAHPYGEYAKTVTFVQWPEVYVVEDPNRKINSRGGVYVNGNTSSGQSWNSVSSLSGTNKNTNMYVLTISVSETYTIGDPRSTEVNLLNYANYWTSSYWTEGTGNQHRLTYYYPGATSGNSDMIAPKIRIASSYGTVSPISRQQAQRRCASYQEDGIPAGRWRLPTFAEVEFIATLSSLNRIPILFSDLDTPNGDYYWTASGAALVDNVGSDKGVTEYNNRSSDSYVRCVYDEWYWGDATESRPLTNERFTWGDRQRTNN